MGNLRDAYPYKVRGANEWMRCFNMVHQINANISRLSITVKMPVIGWFLSESCLADTQFFGQISSFS